MIEECAYRLFSLQSSVNVVQQTAQVRLKRAQSLLKWFLQANNVKVAVEGMQTDKQQRVLSSDIDSLVKQADQLASVATFPDNSDTQLLQRALEDCKTAIRSSLYVEPAFTDLLKCILQVYSDHTQERPHRETEPM